MTLNMLKALPILIIIIVGISTLVGSIAIVNAGHRGILLTWGAVSDRILPEGITFITPFANSVVQMSIQTQKYSATSSSASKDLQIVTTEVTVNYRLNGNTINKIYQELSTDYEDIIIQPAIQEAVKSATARYTAEELIIKRELVKGEIENGLRERVTKFGGIMVQSVSITNFEFSEGFNTAIELKQTAEQLSLKAKNDLERIKIEAEQRVAEATAEAEAIRIQAKALKENPNLISLEWVKKWDGKLPTTMLGENTNVFIPLGDMNQMSNQSA